MDNNILTNKIKQVDTLIQLKNKAEVLKLEMLTFNDNKKEQLLSTADDMQLGDEIREILNTMDEQIGAVYSSIIEKIEGNLGQFINS